MSEIQQPFSVVSRQMGQLASRFTYGNEWQHAEEAANVAAMQATQKVEAERQKGQEVQEWNACIFSLLAVQRALEGRSGTAAAGNTAVEKQQQGETAGNVLRTRSSGPDFRREPTRRGLLGRFGQSSNAYRVGGPFGGGKATFALALVLRKTNFALMLMLWVSPVLEH